MDTHTQQLIQRLSQDANSHVLGQLLAQHCDLRWTPQRLEIIPSEFVFRYHQAYTLIDDDDTLRLIQAVASEIRGKRMAIRIIDELLES